MEILLVLAVVIIIVHANTTLQILADVYWCDLIIQSGDGTMIVIE